MKPQALRRMFVGLFVCVRAASSIRAEHTPVDGSASLHLHAVAANARLRRKTEAVVSMGALARTSFKLMQKIASEKTNSAIDRQENGLGLTEKGPKKDS